jgi:hypothetical protein
MEQKISALKRVFTSCSFAPVTSVTISSAETSGNNFNNPNKENLTKLSSSSSSSLSFTTTSFFIDSSGRSSFIVPLELKFTSKNNLNEFLAAKCLDPPPKNVVVAVVAEDSSCCNETIVTDPTETPATTTTKTTTHDSDPTKIESLDMPLSVLSFEVKSSPKEDIKEVTVEGVTVLSCVASLEDLMVSFQLKVTVRAVLHDDSLSSPVSPVAFSSSPRGVGGVGGAENFHFKNDTQLASIAAAATTVVPPKGNTTPLEVVAALQIIPVLTIERTHPSKENQNDNDADAEQLLALEMAAIPDQMMMKSTMETTQVIRHNPIHLTLTLTHAFTISVTSVPGPNSHMGHTMVSLTIQHSNSHADTVTITNIALHPGHSREDVEAMGRDKEQTVGKSISVDWGPSSLCMCIYVFFSSSSSFSHSCSMYPVLYRCNHSQYDEISPVGLCSSNRFGPATATPPP